MAKDDGGEEQWAADCMQTALPGVRVEVHDDNSAPSMHDLNLWRGESLVGAAEVTTATDPDCTELWNLINGKRERWIVPALRGGWMIMVTPRANAKRLRRELPHLLAGLEATGIRQIGPRGKPVGDAAQLGIVSANQSGTSFPGSIYLSIKQAPEQTGGFVPETGDALADWLTEWMAKPSEVTNLGKLRRSNAEQRHYFVLLPGFTTAPFAVTDLLMRPNAPAPTVPPRLPNGITHVWAMSMWNTGDGFYWSAQSQWARFAKFI